MLNLICGKDKVAGLTRSPGVCDVSHWRIHSSSVLCPGSLRRVTAKNYGLFWDFRHSLSRLSVAFSCSFLYIQDPPPPKGMLMYNCYSASLRLKEKKKRMSH